MNKITTYMDVLEFYEKNLGEPCATHTKNHMTVSEVFSLEDEGLEWDDPADFRTILQAELDCYQ